MSKLVSIPTIIYIVLFLFILFLDYIRPYDFSDYSNKRSGFTIKIDALTGCHYLSDMVNLTPRYGKNGNQICTGAE